MRFLLYGNYFLAFCIVVVYYTHAYIADSGTGVPTQNPRSQWYRENRKLIYFTQFLYTLVIVCLGIEWIVHHYSSLITMPVAAWILFLIFPLVAWLYYGAIFPVLFSFRIRNIAWLKPFLIGFVCTGAVVIYPMLFSSLQPGSAFHLSVSNGCYFLTTWFFTTVIAIMFDIKDFAADHNYHLKTFVVAKGLRYTIFSVLLPLSLCSYFSFLAFALLTHFSFLRVTINTIPFLLLLYTCTTFRRRHGILYYLIVIDGLLLVKALFGIIAMLFVK
jgi:hypothetical protein